MNLSGDAVLAAQQFYKLTHEDIIIVYDDFELPLGKIRIKAKGSAGTHNGMKDILLKLGSREIPRLRIGIGPKPEQWATKDFVLSAFVSMEMSALKEIKKQITEAISCWQSNGIQASMLKHN